MSEPIVYLIQEPTSEKDLSSASKFGKIIPVIGSEEKPAMNLSKIIDKLYNAFEQYNPAQDVICFAGGDPLLEFLSGVVMANLSFPEITHLIWNRTRKGGQRDGGGFYLPKKIRLIDGNYNE